MLGQLLIIVPTYAPTWSITIIPTYAPTMSVNIIPAYIVYKYYFHLRAYTDYINIVHLLSVGCLWCLRSVRVGRCSAALWT